MPGRCAARHISKLDTASVTSPATTSAFRKKSSGEANAMLANRDHGASGSSENSARPALRIAIQKIARAPSSSSAIENVMAVAATRGLREAPPVQQRPGQQQQQHAGERELRGEKAIADALARALQVGVGHRHRRQRLVRRRANHERIRAGIGRAFELQPQGHRNNAGLDRKLGALQRRAADARQLRFGDDGADAIGGIGRIENRLDADQLQALAALRQE